MAWSPLGGGSLFNQNDPKSKRLLITISDIAETLGVDISVVALSWLVLHPAEIVPVIGANNSERIIEACKSVDLKLNRELWFEIYTAAIGKDVP